MKLKKILKERGKTYGSFETFADTSQELKNNFYLNLCSDIEPHHAEAIDMILHKIARIANGNPNFIENWRDIAGYAQLVVDILETKDYATDSEVVKFRPKEK